MLIPVLTWYLRVSLQSTRSWSRLSGSSGIAKSMTSLSWSGLWKSRILVVLSFCTVMWSRRISTTALRNSLVLASVSSALPVWQTGHNSEQKKRVNSFIYFLLFGLGSDVHYWRLVMADQEWSLCHGSVTSCHAAWPMFVTLGPFLTLRQDNIVLVTDFARASLDIHVVCHMNKSPDLLWMVAARTSAGGNHHQTSRGQNQRLGRISATSLRQHPRL